MDSSESLNLHSSNVLIICVLSTGVMLSVSGIGSMVFLAVMKSIIEKIGEANTVIINLVAFGIRSVVYYFLQSVESLNSIAGFII